MNTIKITDNKEEMAHIGKALIAEKSTIYKDNVLASLRKSVAHYIPQASEEEKENRLYRAIYDYWVYGNTVDEDFYLGFDNLTDAQKREYATMRLRMAFYKHLNDYSLDHLFDNKEETYAMFKEYYLRDLVAVRDEGDFEVFADFVKKHPVFVAKPSNMSTGVGVQRIELPANVDLKTFYQDLLRQYIGSNGGSYWRKTTTTIILEELIEQDAALAALHADSVNGIRATTVRVGDKVTVYEPWIKMGAGGSFVASCVLGGIDVGINAETGVCDTLGYGEQGETCERHPTTGVKFMGYRIPRWGEMLSLAKKLASSLPLSINYVGWDFVLTPKGWCVMEGNYRGDFMWQLFRQRGMLKEFEELIGWKPEWKFWWEQ